MRLALRHPIAPLTPAAAAGLKGSMHYNTPTITTNRRRWGSKRNFDPVGLEVVNLRWREQSTSKRAPS